MKQKCYIYTRVSTATQARLDELYDKIDTAEDDIAELQSRIDFLIEQKN